MAINNEYFHSTSSPSLSSARSVSSINDFHLIRYASDKHAGVIVICGKEVDHSLLLFLQRAVQMAALIHASENGIIPCGVVYRENRFVK